MCCRKEWLVLADRLVFVVEDRPSAANPSRLLDLRFVTGDWSGFRLDLLLYLAPESIGIRKCMLDLRPRAGPEVGYMRLAR
jgi:hypothetical protein